jgi:hypothetical protein
VKVNSKPVVSNPLYLREMSEEFAKREGEVKDEERAYVIVRQATEQDNINRAELQAKRQMQWGAGAVSEIVEDNPRQRFMYEVYWTLNDVGNLEFDDGRPVFPTLPANKMKFSDFEKLWGGLESWLTAPIHKAVRKMNPDWDWEGEA